MAGCCRPFPGPHSALDDECMARSQDQASVGVGERETREWRWEHKTHALPPTHSSHSQLDGLAGLGAAAVGLATSNGGQVGGCGGGADEDSA